MCKTALSAMGMISSMAVEVRIWVLREMKANVSVFDVLRPISWRVPRLRRRQRLGSEKGKEGCVWG
jgi:hypothetical protein